MCKTEEKMNKIIFFLVYLVFWKMRKKICIYIFGHFLVAGNECVKKKKKINAKQKKERCRKLVGLLPNKKLYCDLVL